MDGNKRIFYFSPTGNCRNIAYGIADGDEITDLTLPSGRSPAVFSENDDCVFVFPVYNRSVPDVCAEYLKKADGHGAKATFICVYGGVTKGKSLFRVAALAKKSDFRPEKGIYVAAEHCYCDKNKIAPVQEKLPKIVSFLNGENGDGKKFRLKKLKNFSTLQKYLKIFTGKCTFSAEKCSSCGKCLVVCPTGAIRNDLTADSDCILCSACVNACPVKARKIRFNLPFLKNVLNALSKDGKTEFFLFE